MEGFPLRSFGLETINILGSLQGADTVPKIRKDSQHTVGCPGIG